MNKPSGPSTFTAGASASEAAVYVSERSLLPRASRDCGRDAALVPSLVTPPDAAPSFEAGLGDSASATSCSEGESAVGAVSRAPSSYVSAASTQQPFQVEFIRNVVREVFEDFYDQIRQDILNVHMEVLKQSQLQQVCGILNSVCFIISFSIMESLSLSHTGNTYKILTRLCASSLNE